MLIDIPLWMVKDYHKTGSTVICDPPVEDTDIDFCIWVEDIKKVSELMCAAGWAVCGGDAYKEADSDFAALRKGKLNYILVSSRDDYNKWEAAMLLAKHRNLIDKNDRIELFRSIKCGGSKKARSNYISTMAVGHMLTKPAVFQTAVTDFTVTPFITTQGNV